MLISKNLQYLTFTKYQILNLTDTVVDMYRTCSIYLDIIVTENVSFYMDFFLVVTLLLSETVSMLSL